MVSLPGRAAPSRTLTLTWTKIERRPAVGLAGGSPHLGYILPVDKVIDKRLEVVRAPVAVVDIIRVFPDIASEDGLRAVNERVLAVGGLHDSNPAVLDHKPAPA